mgnify:CR=1 FL=1
MPDLDDLRTEILRLTREYSRQAHRASFPGDEKNGEFRPGETTVPYAARCFTEDEVEAAVASTLDFWLTLGKEGEAMEKALTEFLGTRGTVLVNSGSSANLIAVSALTTPKLPPERRLRKGDEVITCAAGFPTTVAPLIQNGLIPVFLDNDPVTGNIRTDLLEEAYVEGKTKAVMIAHTLGNPFDLATLTAFCRDHGLWLIEDNCDALGSTYTENGRETRYTGTFGDLSTQSFYPPHHLTMGEGGAVNIVSRRSLRTYVESFRDWGRDCWCPSGVDNTCGKRFKWQLGDLPEGYDHKYIYSHFGYNVKPLDIQAAIGRVQMKRLPDFIQARINNWETLRRGLADLEDCFSFSLPTHSTGWSPDSGFSWNDSGHRCLPSWFGFMLRVKPDAPFTRNQLAQHLDAHKISNRMLFGGNLVKQPFFVNLLKEDPAAFRVVGELPGADSIMNDALFLGTYPGLNQEMLDYELEVIHDFAKSS